MRGKKIHLILFFLRLHLAVNESHLIIAESLADILIAVFERLQVKLLIFLDERVDDVDLPPEPELPSDALICLESILS